MPLRHSGILLHISSLPSPYGIGTMGKAAYEFVDFLVAAGQKYWQVLPMGPTSHGDSPYQSFSSFAGNPYFIDLDLLVEDGLLTEEELSSVEWGSNPRYVDYSKVYEGRFPVLRKAFRRGWERDRQAVETFLSGKRWLQNYALFMALKGHFGNKCWMEWPDEEIRLKKPAAVEKYSVLLEEDVNFFIYLQFLFFQQWNDLRMYAGDMGIQIIGDLPIYVALDSADVWSEPEFFQLDEKNVPVKVAGVPPDYFSADGQLWGNPLYDYEKMRKDGFGWWVRRMEGVSKLYDVVRIDHFRGFESYWAVPYGAETAKTGQWVTGPGMDLVGVLTGRFPKLQIIAEDLGILTPKVEQLLKDSGLPGMKVLEFAFDPKTLSAYLPHAYDPHCVCYVGTHDNETVMEWLNSADPQVIAFAKEYLRIDDEKDFNWKLIAAGQRSVAERFVAQLQDYLGLGAEGRMNTPGVASGNWQWRTLPGEITEELTEKIYRLTWMYGRCPSRAAEKAEAVEKPVSETE